MKKLFSVLFLLPVTMIGVLSGCGGGSGKSGDDGNVSLAGQQATLFKEGNMQFRLQFGGQDVDVFKMEEMSGAVSAVYHDETYTYHFHGDTNSGVLNVASSSQAACVMENVKISFEDAERKAGVVASGTVRETGPDLDPSVHDVSRPMAGWTCRVHRD